MALGEIAVDLHRVLANKVDDRRRAASATRDRKQPAQREHTHIAPLMQETNYERIAVWVQDQRPVTCVIPSAGIPPMQNWESFHIRVYE